MTIYSSSGSFIDENDDSCGSQSEITWTADFDGEYKYSQTVHVNNHSTLDMLSLFPNPTRGEINLTLQVADYHRVEFAICDLSGRKHRAEVLHLEPGVNIFNYDMSDLNSGLYILQITDELDHSLLSEKMFKK